MNKDNGDSRIWLEDWDYEKNNPVDPLTVAPHSNKQYYWKCHKGHPSYLTSPSHKCRGHGCPVCSNHKILKGVNDFATLNPELMEEWSWEENDNDGVFPDKISSKSGAIASWKCKKCGNIWKSSITNRVRLHSGCPYCANFKLKNGYNDLATVRPELAKEWNYEKNGDLTPDKIVAYSATKIWWKCQTCGNEWRSTPNQRTKTNCPYCSNHAIKAGDNDLETLRPDIVKEWDYSKNISVQPSQVAPGSEKSVWWICGKGHSWKANINSRVSGRGCPYCSNKKILVGYNDLFTLSPELKKEWDFEKNANISPEHFTSGSNKRVWWKCQKCGNSWLAYISSRTRGTGCPKCGIEKNTTRRLKTMAKRNNFVEKYPNIAKEWDYEKNGGRNPQDFTVSSNKKVWWKCEKGHSYASSINQRTSSGAGCPYCHNQRVIPGETDLETLNPLLAAEWDYDKNMGITPQDVLSHSSKYVWWKCPVCGYSWRTRVNNRANGRGCPNCSPKGTSFIEQTVYFYIKQAFPDTIHRHRIKNREFDIFIPLMNTAIEYDGAYFHSLPNATDRENRKDIFCENNGIKLIRLREKPLENTQSAECISCDCSNWDGIEETIKVLLKRLGKENQLDISVKRDVQNIITSKRILMKENCFGKDFPDILKEWDYDKNDSLRPEYFSKGCRVKVWWKCSKGHSWEAAIANRCNGTGCPECFNIKRKKGLHKKKRIIQTK